MPEPRRIQLHVAGRGTPIAHEPDRHALSSLHAAGIPMDTECGGLGRCGLCRVQFLDGAPPPSRADRQFFGAADLADGWRLACTAFPTTDARLAVPDALTAAPFRILTAAAGAPEETGRARAARAGFGVAIDVGTTTVVCYVTRLSDGQVLDVAAFANPQRAYGSDVLSRIVHAHRGAAELEQLRTVLIDAVERHVFRLCEAHAVDAAHVHALTLVGNSTMMHLLRGVDPWPLGVAPYRPAFTTVPEGPADALGFRRLGHARAAVLPGIGGQLGSDTVAGLLALGPRLRNGIHLYVDLGTNGEIVLLLGDTALGCSCAAGPAFEGVRISAGTPAVRGAIDTVAVVDGRLQVTTIGDAAPVGICGSGLVDTVAVLLQHGVLDPSGRLRAGADLPDELSADLRSRVRDEAGARTFTVHAAADAPVVLTQQDLRQLQLAKGAVRTGVDLLLREAGIAAADVARVYVAGAFGTALRPVSVAALGVFPPALRDRIEPVGNAAGLGAQLALAAEEALAEAHRIARWVRHVSLAEQPDFHRVFAESMRFPDPAPRA